MYSKVIFLLTVFPIIIFGACPSGSVQGPSGKCYQAFSDHKNWLDAETACNKFGNGVVNIGHLAPVSNAFENKFLATLALNHSLVECWLGGEDNYYDKIWYWNWSDVFTDWNYTNWAKGLIFVQFKNHRIR